MKRFPAGFPLLDPVADMHIKDDEFKKVVKVCWLCTCCIVINRFLLEN